MEYRRLGFKAALIAPIYRDCKMFFCRLKTCMARTVLHSHADMGWMGVGRVGLRPENIYISVIPEDFRR